jgi:hypothetical protein
MRISILRNHMSHPNSSPQESQVLHETIVISSTVQEQLTPIKICWNTGEEKNCAACYLSKGCKAKG